MSNRIIAVVPAAGLGKRFGMERNKQFETLRGRPVMIWAIEILDQIPEIAEIIPVIKETYIGLAEDLFKRHGIKKIRCIAPGGKERQDCSPQRKGFRQSGLDRPTAAIVKTPP